MSTSVLTTRGNSGGLALAVIVAMFLHAGVIAAMVLAQYLADMNRDPIVDVKPVEISLQLKPKTDRKMEQKAIKAPAPTGVQAPTADPKVKAPPKVSEMKLETPDVKEAKGAPDRCDDRNKLLKQLMMQAALEDAAEGSVDQSAASPDSESAQGAAGNQSGVHDPVLAAYETKIQQLFREAFSPLPTLKGMDCVLSLETDQTTGRITKYWVSTSSGNMSYDSACERAAPAVGTIPLPPENYKARYARGYNIRLKPKN